MEKEEINRKNLDSEEFLKLRHATGKIASVLDQRLRGHLEVLKPLFVPKKLFGSYIKSSAMAEVTGSDKAFAALQEHFASVCEKPFGLLQSILFRW